MILANPRRERIRNTTALRQKFLRETEQFLAGELRLSTATSLQAPYTATPTVYRLLKSRAGDNPVMIHSATAEKSLTRRKKTSRVKFMGIGSRTSPGVLA